MTAEQQDISLGAEGESRSATGPVTCLGLTFENDENRRNYFSDKLRKKLQDPEFRKIEGFPVGEDEDILVLSDPPYYTACPNPWITDFIAEWEAQKPDKPADYQYHREPFAADVSEGKNDPIYNAHSYHTKVPHKAIMRYILHYTEPGDIVFDGFCGTGMTGVAAQMCGERDAVMSLGYQVTSDGAVLREETGEDGKKTWQPFSRLGARRAVLNDLSPAATFIAYNYNTPVDVVAFEREAKRILKEVEEECGWMYETLHADGRTKGKINYTVWSDVFVCPECTGEVVFYEVAVDKEAGKVRSSFPCPHCSAELTKQRMERAWETRHDSAINETIKQAKQIPVLINYSLNGRKGRFEKTLDEHDLELIRKIDESEILDWFPKQRMLEGQETRRNDPLGLTHVHHFFTKRNLWILSAILFRCDARMRLVFQSVVATLCSRFVRYNLGNRGNGPLSGTLYVSSLNAETEVLKVAQGKINDFVKALISNEQGLTQCQSLESISFVSNCIDYIFIDPPFGANLNYSELNSIWESWLKVHTNNTTEAIENKIQGKGPNEYRQLMTACFKKCYRVLKPGGWMTVEFSNTKAAVWNAIQTALTDAGFVIANVSALDKQQGSFKAVTTPTAVKQDLVISTYKPNGGFEGRFKLSAGTEKGVWEFVRTHLKQLPIFLSKQARAEVVAERQNYLLFDRMVAFHVQRGVTFPLSASEFHAGLEQRFPMRDAMYFLPEQVDEYDKKRMTVNDVVQSELFVSDEASAIQWLKQQITSKPQTSQDIHPQFLKEISGWKKHEQGLELSELLEQNFLRYDGQGVVPSQVHSYLSSNFKELRNLAKDSPTLRAKAKDRWYMPDPNKATDLEKKRENDLLREFEGYKQASKKLRIFRLEAVRAGFKRAWEGHDYDTIITVASKIPEIVLQEDEKLIRWHDYALARLKQN